MLALSPSSSFSFCHVRKQQKDSLQQAKKRVLTKNPTLLVPWSQTSQSPEWEINACLSDSVDGILLEQPQLTKTMPEDFSDLMQDRNPLMTGTDSQIQEAHHTQRGKSRESMPHTSYWNFKTPDKRPNVGSRISEACLRRWNLNRQLN